MPATLVSAPGKVLLAGGYLVLDPAYSGVVVSTSSRFYTFVQDSSSVPEFAISVSSPQFLDATWNYAVALEPSLHVEPLKENASSNKFVHLALQSVVVLAAQINGPDSVREKIKPGINITIVGDNDFYSQRAKLEALNLPRTLASLSEIPPFSATNVRLLDVHKTGLGSSASLITSLTSALLVHLAVIPEASLSEIDNDGRKLAHNLAQYVHCRAQGKVGSGFDVSAAVFGSHLYTRFNPSVIQGLMGENSPTDLLSVLSPSNKEWNYQIGQFKLPPLTRLMLADVDAGSDTPSLVSKVLKWRKEDPVKANTLWTHLDQLNKSLAQTLLHLSKLHDEDPINYSSAVKYICSLQPLQWGVANPLQTAAERPIIKTFYETHKISQQARQNMKEMGNLAGVPIEPEEQTRLLDTCVSQAGIIGGGVPGAGGYDAIWLLVCDPLSSHPDQSPQERIEHLWSHYTELKVSPLSSKESLSKGIRLESIESIHGLKELVLP